MDDNVIVDKTFALAVRIVNLYKYITAKKNEYVLSKTQEISKQFAFSDLFVDNAKNCIPIEEKKQLNEIETIYKIKGLDAYLSPEMKSTGEAIGYDDKLNRALYKALQASGMSVANYGTILMKQSHILKR